MKKKIVIAIINWVEVLLLVILNFSLNIGLLGHICLLSYAFVRFEVNIICDRKTN